MASASQSKLPVFNMEDLNPGTESWKTTSHKVRRALEEYGCFMAIYGGFSHDVKTQVFGALKTLFDLPIETKMKNASDKSFHGYTGPSHTRPLLEIMGIERATSYDNVQRFANLMWPSGYESFSKSLHSYAKLVTELENMVRKMIFESYGVDKYYESFNESMTCVLKNQVGGLEVQMKDEDEWMTVEYLPSSFVVMATDAFMAWSNDRLRYPRHRVIMNGQEDRYSIGFFSYKKGTVEIPEELTDDEHPRRFKSFDN